MELRHPRSDPHPGHTVRPHAVIILVAALVLLAGCSATAPAPPAPVDEAPAPVPPAVPGLAIYRSDADVAETVRRLQDGLGRAGMVVATVDHAANAASVGQPLRPTTLVVGANPRAGTPLIARAQPAGIDLPAKFLAWQDAAGAVYLAHNTPGYLAVRAGLPADTPAVSMLRTGQQNLARMASGGGAPVSAGDDLAGVGAEGYLVERPSPRPVPEVIAAYQQAFAAGGLSPVATVDHAANAARTGTTLAPTTVTLAGNPAAGTPLLQAAQTIGIDLPTRYLAWQDAGGTTRVAHPDIRTLAARHGITGQDQTLTRISQATERLSATAAGP